MLLWLPLILRPHTGRNLYNSTAINSQTDLSVHCQPTCFVTVHVTAEAQWQTATKYLNWLADWWLAPMTISAVIFPSSSIFEASLRYRQRLMLSVAVFHVASPSFKCLTVELESNGAASGCRTSATSPVCMVRYLLGCRLQPWYP